MKIINLIVSVLIVIVIQSCSKEDDLSKTRSPGFYIDESVSITLINKDSIDLLDPHTKNSYNRTRIKLFHLVNNKKVEFFNGFMDYASGYRIYTPNEINNSCYEFCLMITNVDGSTNEASQSTTYIQWNDNDTDTIKCQLVRKEGYFGCSKVWCNGKVVWTEGDSKNRVFNLVK